MNDAMNKMMKRKRSESAGQISECQSKTDLLWGGSRVLNQEGRKLGLRDDGELGVGAADVPFPVRVLRRVGRWRSVGWVRKKTSPSGWRMRTTNLWWPGWHTSLVENQEEAAGSRLGVGGHWISLGRRRPHHLFKRTFSDNRHK